jgi:hypothetical protein
MLRDIAEHHDPAGRVIAVAERRDPNIEGRGSFQTRTFNRKRRVSIRFDRIEPASLDISYADRRLRMACII